MSSTLVTAGDKRFFWGLYLLVASLRMHNMTNPIKCLVKGLSEGEESALEQFDVDIHRSEDVVRPLQAQKPAALLIGVAESDYVTWIDADCIVDGNVSDLLLPTSPEEIMIRFREPEENILRFNNKCMDGSIPEDVKNIWCEDVSDSRECQITSTCVTNIFTIHKCNFDLVHRWDEQIQIAIKKHSDDFSNAYTHSSGSGISDELVLCSLFAFAMPPYKFSPYRLDKEKGSSLLHLSLKPKPWELWTVPSLKYYNLVFSILEWARANDYVMPHRPWSLVPSLKPLAYSTAFLHEVARRTAHGVGLRRVVMPR